MNTALDPGQTYLLLGSQFRLLDHPLEPSEPASAALFPNPSSNHATKCLSDLCKLWQKSDE